jgi:hypothetical protein
VLGLWGSRNRPEVVICGDRRYPTVRHDHGRVASPALPHRQPAPQLADPAWPHSLVQGHRAARAPSRGRRATKNEPEAAPGLGRPGRTGRGDLFRDGVDSPESASKTPPRCATRADSLSRWTFGPQRRKSADDAWCQRRMVPELSRRWPRSLVGGAGSRRRRRSCRNRRRSTPWWRPCGHQQDPVRA